MLSSIEFTPFATPSRVLGRTARNQFHLLEAIVNQNCNLQFLEFLIGHVPTSCRLLLSGGREPGFRGKEENRRGAASWQAG